MTTKVKTDIIAVCLFETLDLIRKLMECHLPGSEVGQQKLDEVWTHLAAVVPAYEKEAVDLNGESENG